MCGRPFVAHGKAFGAWSHHSGHARFLGSGAVKMSPKVRVAAAASVLVPVTLSGFALIAFAPGLWWIFTTYGWVAFPALGLLTSGIAEAGPERIPRETKERELLEALREHGELTAARAAMQTSLSVAEADNMLEELAEGGHLEVRVRGGGIFYALWESEARELEARR